MRDPGFLSDADKQKLEVQPVPGEEIQKLVVEMFQSPREVVEAARKAIERSQ
jgi:hypothetical protein